MPRKARLSRRCSALRRPGGAIAGSWAGLCPAARSARASRCTDNDGMPHPPPSPARLRHLIEALGAGLLAREAAVRLALLAALAGEHLLMIGPPGTAKSALARRLHRAWADAPYFERLLTRFSTPEELFGPLSLQALEADRYERLTAGYLPQAGIAFLDEVFKANSAILNALLTLLNERVFDNGVQRIPVPLVAVVAASNEVPGDEALQAFFDRFLLRVPVQPLGDEQFAALLTLPVAGQADDGPLPGALAAADRLALAAAAARCTLSDDLLAACQQLRQFLAAQRWPASDRRWRQFVGLLRVQAASDGRTAPDRLDLWLVPYVFSPTPEEVPALQDWFTDTALQVPPPQAPWLERAVQAFEQQLALEERAEAEDPSLGGSGAGTQGFPGEGAGKLALARAIGLADPDAGDTSPGGSPQAAAMPRLVSERLRAQLRRHYSPVHVAARLAQIEEIAAPLQVQQTAIEASLASLRAALQSRLWMPPALADGLLQRQEATLALLGSLLARLATTRAGFAALPCDPSLPETAPAPVQWPAGQAAAA